MPSRSATKAPKSPTPVRGSATARRLHLPQRLQRSQCCCGPGREQLQRFHHVGVVGVRRAVGDQQQPCRAPCRGDRVDRERPEPRSVQEGIVAGTSCLPGSARRFPAATQVAIVSSSAEVKSRSAAAIGPAAATMAKPSRSTRARAEELIADTWRASATVRRGLRRPVPAHRAGYGQLDADRQQIVGEGLAGAHDAERGSTPRTARVGSGRGRRPDPGIPRRRKRHRHHAPLPVMNPCAARPSVRQCAIDASAVGLGPLRRPGQQRERGQGTVCRPTVARKRRHLLRRLPRGKRRKGPA